MPDADADSNAAPPRPRQRSLRELLGRDAASADVAFGNNAPRDAWDSITNTLNTLDAPTLPAASPVQTPASPPQQRALAGDAKALVLQDHTLRKALDVSSTRSLDWLLSPSALAECDACDMTSRRLDEPAPVHVDVPVPVDAVDEDALYEDAPPHQHRAEVLLCAALTNYRHPAAPVGVPPARWHEQLNDESSPCSLRVELWQDALRAAYYALRHKRSRGFWVCLHDAAVHFRPPPTPSARLSRAGQSMQEYLREHGVQYEQASGAGAGGAVEVRGQRPVHALYNMLLAVAPTLPMAADVPLIVSDDPFRLAVLMPAVVQHAYEATDDEGVTKYAVRIAGDITPLQIQRLAAAVTLMQDFDLSLTDDPLFGPPLAAADVPRIARISCVHGELRAFGRRL